MHLLLVRIGARLWAVDTTSTNGTFELVPGEPPRRLRQIPLEVPKSLALAGAARVCWAPAG